MNIESTSPQKHATGTEDGHIFIVIAHIPLFSYPYNFHLADDDRYMHCILLDGQGDQRTRVRFISRTGVFGGVDSRRASAYNDEEAEGMNTMEADVSDSIIDDPALLQHNYIKAFDLNYLKKIELPNKVEMPQ